MRAATGERREARAMKKEMHGGSTLTDLRLDARYALRGLLRTPGFSLVALLTLALGIGATTAVFSVANAALGRALPYHQPDRLVMGRATFEGRVNPWVSFPDYMDYRDQAESLESLVAISGGANLATVTGGDEPRQVGATFVTANLFETLGVRPVVGSSFTIDELPADGAGQVVISHAFWQSWFGGDPDVVGRSLVADGTTLTVMGVMPREFRFMYDTDLWVPPWPGNSNPINRRFHNWLLVGRLGAGASLDGAGSEIDLISTQLQNAYPDSNRDKALQLDGLQNALVEGYRESLLLLMGAIGLVLLIACSNVANLLMARGSTRSSEMAVRAAMGAGWFRLTRQLLVECLLLALAAGGLGVLLAVWLQDLMVGFVAMDRLGIEASGLSPTMLGIALVLSLGTVLLFGIIPSLVTSRAHPAEELKEGGRGSTGGAGMRFRSGLVVVQVALSLVLLVTSGLLIRSFATLRDVDPGFRVENLLTATISLPRDRYVEAEERIQFFRSFREEVEALPGAEAAVFVNRLPILQTSGNVAIWAPERPPETTNDTPWADRRVVLPGYFGTMEIPLLQGRVFNTQDVEGAPPVIVLARRTAELVFPDENPLGRQVAVDLGREEPGYFEVVGVVEDHQLSSLSGERRPAMFFPYAQMAELTMRIAVATRVDPSSLQRPVQERLWELDRDMVLSQPRTMEDAIAESISGTRSVTTVLGLFAFVAIVLAALGLYGVLAFFVNRRRHEIGIRVALGASRGKVLGLVIGRGMALVALGLVLGIAGAVGASRFVEEMLFRVDATDLATYGGVTVLFLALALTTCFLPAWRAVRVDPVQAFRAE
jgi:putative ABC transport system permease protein